MKKNKRVKVKTTKSVKRRIKVTGTGKLMRKKSFGRHLNAGKSKSRSRRLAQSVQVGKAWTRKFKRALGIA